MRKSKQRTEKVDRAFRVVPAVGVVHFGTRCAGKGDLPCERTGPDDDSGDRDEGQSDETPCTPSVREAVENEEANDQSADYGAKTLERSVQRSYTSYS